MSATRRYELTDFEWSIIEPLLPNKPRGVPRADDRRVLNGIYWRLRTGSPWADIPERYGPATTCYNRFVRWRRHGVWDRIFEQSRKPMTAICRWSTPRPFACTSMLPTSKRGLGRSANRRWGRRCKPMHGALARRTDDQDPRARGRQRHAYPPQAHRRPGS